MFWRLRITLLASLATLAHAQSEAALQRYFEGKQVRVRIDMPGTHDGIDLYWKKDPPVDFKSYSQRLKKYGVALRDGDTVRITTVKLKQKNIEFQLGGGGYGTAGDDSGSVYLPSTTKSNRESDLEKDVRNETDKARRDNLNRELSRLRDSRLREESYRRARQTELEMVKKREIEQKRLAGGSRFNLWIPAALLAESPATPEMVMEALAGYVDFSPMQERPMPDRSGAPVRLEIQAPAPRPASVSVPDRLRRGLTRDQVRSMLGIPKTSTKRAEGQLEVETDVFEDAEDRTEVEFVSGVVVRFRVVSR